MNISIQPTISLSLAQAPLVLLVLCLLCIVSVALIYFLRTRRVARAAANDFVDSDKAPGSWEPVSVVVYSQDDAENLQRLLASLLSQDYPAPYEVIVVNEGESSDIRDLVSMLRSQHTNLYLTSTPDGVRNLSRKKLGVTLGIKAARYGLVTLTTTAVDIPSSRWLRGLMHRFSPDSPVEIVLGFAGVDPEEDNARGARRRAFDFAAESARWLGAALAGNPFRGVEYNLAYRKALFMRNNGFARSLNLHNGDDDIFVSEIARGDNTAVELSPESRVILRNGNDPRFFRERMVRRSFTEGFIRRRPFFLAALSGWLQFAALGLGIAASVISWPNVLPAIITLLLMILVWALDIFIWRRLMKALNIRLLRLSIPWLSMTYPFRKLLYLTDSRFGKLRKYTWN